MRTILLKIVNTTNIYLLIIYDHSNQYKYIFPFYET